MRPSLLAIAVLLSVQSPKGSIEGVVVDKASSKPIAEARVELFSSLNPLNPLSRTTTDDKGHFAFAGLEGGDFRVAVEKSGYALESGMASVFSNAIVGRPVNLKAGEVLNDLEFQLTPEGIVSGRVIGTRGEPMANAEVRLVMGRYDAIGRKTYGTAGAVAVNDRGEYRLWGLQPGRYYLLASSPQLFTAANIVPNIPDNISGQYNATYYPGTTVVTDASVLEIRPGTTLEKVDITMLPRLSTRFRIRGRIVGARLGQEPQKAVQYTFFPREENGTSFRRFYTTTADGTFEIEDLEPGSYVIQAQIQAQVRRPEAGEPRVMFPTVYAQTEVDIVSSDVSGVVVTFNPVSVTGRLRVEEQSEAPRNVVATLRAYGVNSPQPSVVKEDGTFAFADLNTGGEYYLSFSGLAPDAYLKLASMGHTDLRYQPLRISSSVVGGIEVVIGLNGARLIGDGAAANSRVALVPEDRERRDLYKGVPADMTGQFSIRGIPPGDYKLFVFENAPEPFPYFDKEFMRSAESSGRALQFIDAETKTVHLRP